MSTRAAMTTATTMGTATNTGTTTTRPTPEPGLAAEEDRQPGRILSRLEGAGPDLSFSDRADRGRFLAAGEGLLEMVAA
jgi:hypothetical protein